MPSLASASESTVMLADTLPIVAVEVNGKTFVAGLLWELMPSAKRFAEDAKRLGGQYGADIVAYRIGVGKARQVQAGFAPKRKLDLTLHRLDDGNAVMPTEGRRKSKRSTKPGSQRTEGNTFKGMYSWAAAVCGVVGDNCLIGIKLGDDLYGIAAQVDGFIIPESDVIVTRDEFITTFTQIYTRGRQGRFSRVFAPAEFDVATEELSVRDILSPKNVTKLYRLKPLNRWDYSKKQVIGSVIAAVVVGTAIIGALALKHHYGELKKQQALIAANMEGARERHMRALQKAAHEQANIVHHPWPDQLGPAEALDACMDDLHHSPLSIGGWLLTKAECNLYNKAAPGNATITLTYVRPKNGTDFRTFAVYASDKFGKPASADAHYSVAMFDFTKVVMPTEANDLKPAALAQSDIMSFFQRKQQAASLSRDEGYKPAPNQKDPPRQDFTSYKLTVSNAVSTPSEVLADIDPKGLRIIDITADITPSDGAIKWQIEGYLYVH